MCVWTISLSITLNSWSGPRFNLRMSFLKIFLGGMPPDPLVLACWLCFAQYRYLKYFIAIFYCFLQNCLPNHQLLHPPLYMMIPTQYFKCIALNPILLLLYCSVTTIVTIWLYTYIYNFHLLPSFIS